VRSDGAALACGVCAVVTSLTDTWRLWPAGRDCPAGWRR